ncbi:MAG: hypothetical protein K0U54_13055, partial [Bacteroidetes bacterium]|nr:hypothetical protein [Bacteroidota bacterium]
LKYIFQHYRLLAQLASKKKDFANASNYFKESLLYNDSILKAKKENEVEKVLLKYKVQQQEEQVATLTAKNRYLNTIYLLVFVGILLIVLLISRQLKIKKMTQNIYEAQRQLVNSNTPQKKQKEISSFDATVAGDKEFKGN